MLIVLVIIAIVIMVYLWNAFKLSFPDWKGYALWLGVPAVILVGVFYFIYKLATKK